MRILTALAALVLTGCESPYPVKSAGLERGVARGVLLKKDGHVLFGSAAVTTTPASIDFQKVRRATAEWRRMRAEGIQPGTGRWDLLTVAMNDRIRRAVVAAAETRGRDCVFRAGDLKRAHGLRIFDLTAEVLQRLN